MGMKKIILSAVILCIPALPCFSLNKETCFASLDKSVIRYGEKVQYTITVNYAVNTLPPVITPPVFENFTVSGDYSVINEAGSGGERYKIQKRTWVLKPDGTGHFTITPALVTFRDPVSGMLVNETISPFYVDVGPPDRSITEKNFGKEMGFLPEHTVKGKTVLYIVLASAGIVLLMLAALYLLTVRKRKSEIKSSLQPEDHRAITFIGTSHIDPDGYAGLMELLNSLHPEIILLEVSPLSVILRRTYGHILKLILRRNLKALKLDANPEIRNSELYLDIPYEYRAVKDYCRTGDAKYILADISFYTLRRFIHVHELVTKKNLAALSAVQEDRFLQEKSAAYSIFNKCDTVMPDIKLQQFSKDPPAIRREKILVKRLKKYTARYSGREIVYVGGWEHMLDDPQHRLLYSACDSVKQRIITLLK